MPLDKKVTERGLVAGKDVKTIMLDTGADTSVAAGDLVLEGTTTQGTMIVKGLGREWMPCPFVSLPVFVKGKGVTLRALVFPRSIVGRDVWLGRDILGLDFDWHIRAIEATPAD